MSPSTNLGATLHITSGGGTNITKSTSFNIVVKSALPTDKSFSELTDSELLQIVQALDNNLITTADLNWQVGDSRNVSLGSFQTYSSSTSRTDTQETQIAQLVIMNIGGKTFNGNGTSLDNTTCHYVVGFKDCVCNSYWATSKNTYANSLIKTVENNIYNALPNEVKMCFKKFNVITGTYSVSAYGQGGANVTSQQYFTSAAEKEIFNSRSDSSVNEANALSQLTYFKTSSNRIKKFNTINSRWRSRSPSCYSEYYCIDINTDGTVWMDDGDEVYRNAYGVSPFGCI